MSNPVVRSEILPEPDKFARHIANQANFARAFHETWRAMTGPALLPTYSTKLNEVFCLSKTIETSLQSSFIITLCSLYDEGKDAISLHRFSRFILHRDGELSKEWSSQFRDVRKQMKKLYAIRSHAFAHQLDSRFKRNIFLEIGYSNSDVSEMAEKSWNLTSDLLRSYDGRNLVFGMSTLNDIRLIFPEINMGVKWAKRSNA